jgi:hypothetical protein
VSGIEERNANLIGREAVPAAAAASGTVELDAASCANGPLPLRGPFASSVGRGVSFGVPSATRLPNCDRPFHACGRSFVVA